MTKWFHVLLLLVAVCPFARATTYYLSNSQSTSSIQSIISGSSPGDTVSFAQGQYSITSGITLRCGVTYTGPAVTLNANGEATPTATLNGSINYHTFNLYSAGLSLACSQPTIIQYFNFAGGNGINTQTPYTNLLVQYNTFTSIPGSTDRTDAMFFASASGANNTNAQLTNTTVTHNVIGDSNSCISPTNVMADVHSPEDYNGACLGIAFFTSINGFTLTYNNFNHLAEPVHMDCPNYANQKYACEPPGGAITKNITVQYNDFNQTHRIVWEEQAQQTGGVVFQYNSEHDWYNPYFGAFGTSFACCYNGVSTPYLNVASNIILFNVPPTNDVRYGYGTEGMGKGATYVNNMIQAGNYTVNSSYPPGPGIVYGCGPNAAMSYNTVQGNFHGAYLASEGNLPCGSVSQPASFTGNVTGPTTSSYPSAGPTISPAPGSYSSPLLVTLTDNGFTSGSLPLGNTSVWYTTDGTTPVPGKGTAKIYSGPFPLSLPATLKAVGMWGAANQPTSYPAGFGFTPSAVVTTSYSTSGSAPTLTLSSVSIALPQPSLTAGAGGETATATCNYSDGSNDQCGSATDPHGYGPVSWTSSSPGTASIDAGGVITPLAAGSTNISATLGVSHSNVLPLSVVATSGGGSSMGGASVALGQSTENYSGTTYANAFNSVYSITPSTGGPFTPGACHFYILGTVQSGKHWDCLIITAPSATTEASTALCKATYTTTSTTGPGKVNITPTGCGTISTSTAYWVATITDDTSNPEGLGFYDCGGTCNGSAPTSGPGSYPGYWVGVTYGSYTSLPSGFSGTNPRQAALWVDLTSNTPTLVTAYQDNTGTLNQMVRGSGYQMHAYCLYSDSIIQQCDTADARGDAVSSWGVSDTAVLSTASGLITGLNYGTANSTCVVNGSLNCLIYTWHILPVPAVADSYVGMTLQGLTVQ